MHTLRHALCGALLTLTLSAADSFKPEAGFVSLFNGKDLSGWCYRDGQRKDEKVEIAFDGKTASTDGRFSAKDGVLTVHPREPRLAQKIWTTDDGMPREKLMPQWRLPQQEHVEQASLRRSEYETAADSASLPR